MRSFIFLCVIFASPAVYIVDCQTTSEKCSGADAGSLVCIDCKTEGTCTGIGSEVIISECPFDDTICDETEFPGEGCFLGLSLSTCGCLDTDECILDPNNDAALVDCSNSTSPGYLSCEDEMPNLSTCECNTITTSTLTSTTDDSTMTTDESTTTTTTDDSGITTTTDESTTTTTTDDSGITTTTDESITTTTTDDSGIKTTTDESTTTTTTTMTTIAPTEPSTTPIETTSEDPCIITGCGYAPDPSGDCGSYFKCVEGELVPQHCPGVTCFNADTCLCELTQKADYFNF